MASDSVLLSPPSMVTGYTDTSVYNIFTNVIGKSIAAYEDLTSTPVNLTIGGSSNVEMEAVSGINMYVLDTGAGLKLFSTTFVNNVRTDREILSIASTSNATWMTATSSNTMVLQGGDAYNSVSLGNALFSSSNDKQLINATGAANRFVISDPIRTTGLAPVGNLVASEHLYCRDMNLWVSTGLSNLGELSEAGYSFRINSNSLQLEVIKFNKVVTQCNEDPELKSSKSIYKRVGIFGTPNINSNMNSEQHAATFTGFSSFSNMLSRYKMY